MSKRKEKNTEHPHIKKIIGPSGIEQAVIGGTSLRVWSIIAQYQMGMSIEEILNSWNYITPAQLFDSLAYYHDHKDEIDEIREKNYTACELFFKKTKVNEHPTVFK